MTHSDQRGFTLLELMVAIGIFAVFSAIAYGGLSQVLRIQQRLIPEHTLQRQIMMAFMRLQEDLSQVRGRQIRSIDGTRSGGFIGRPSDARALGLANMEFTRGGGPIVPLARRSDLLRVAYRINEQGELLRITWPVLDRAPTTEATEHVILSQVEDFQARFTTGKNNWTTNWPPIGVSNTNSSAPRGVEIKITITGLGEITRLYYIRS